MKALLHLLMVAGLLVGLATQSAARSAKPCPMEQAHGSTMAGIGDCCPEGKCTDDDGALSGDLALHCLTMAGCAALGALEFGAMAGMASQDPGAAQVWPLAATLDGWSVPPDTHPPALLA